jgi:hypothetical protein
MDVSDQAEMEIELIGPAMGMAFWTEPVEGISVQQYL